VGLLGSCALVTGGAGFVGSHIVDQLVDAGCAKIIVIDNLVRGRRDNLARVIDRAPVEVIEGDIRDGRLMDGLVQSADVVFHQAALRITHCAAEPQQAFDVMVKATFDLVRMCVDHGVQKLVMASSASVYGLAGHFPTRENEPPYANRTLYGGAKVFGESLLRAFNDMSGLNYVALRYFNVYGPRMDRHGKYTEVLIRWMERIQSGEPPLVFGDGDETMDMVHVRDVARANILAASKPVGDIALNIGSGQEVTLYDLATRLTRVMGRHDLVPEHRPRRTINPVPRRWSDISAARQLLGFQPTLGIDEGLRDLVAWWRMERQQDISRSEQQVAL
jgi:UDP-glucose 4-epimerase